MIAVLYWIDSNDSTLVDGIFKNFKELKEKSNYYYQSKNSIRPCDKPRWVEFECNSQDLDFDFWSANDFYIKSKITERN